MDTATAVITIAGTLATAAAGLAAALKLLAAALVKAIRELKPELESTRGSLDANTAALAENTAALAGKSRPASAGALRRAVLLLFLALALVSTLAGCVSGPDPLIVRSLERNREVWEQDRRADLDPELVKSRAAEFDAQMRYAQSK